MSDLDHQLPSSVYFHNSNDKILSIIQVTEQEVFNLLNKVDISKACGHDGIGNKIIKLCSHGIVKSFTRLINLSPQDGKYSLEWKKANISPIYKKDNRQSKKNYRPISLLPLFLKYRENWYLQDCMNFF